MPGTAAPPGTPEHGSRGLRRRRAAVVNADIVDYSRLMADDESATVAAVREYQEVVAGLVDAAGGVLVNFVGDSFVAVFDDARTAIGTAISICRAVDVRNRPLPRTRRMWFRVGIDIGDIVIADDGRHFGEPLNVAARVQAMAEVGGINVTEAVFKELDEPGLRLIGLGRRRLKNIPGMVRVYRLADVAETGDSRPALRAGAGTPTVAVLPVIVADDPTGRDVAEMLRLDLTTALSQTPGLRVLDAPPDPDADQMVPPDADHGAAYILVSGLTRAGRRLRAYAQFYETATMNTIWAQRWEGTTDDVFALQDAFTSDTVRAVDIELVIGEPARIYRAVLDSGAVTAVYQGWYHFHRNTRHAWRTAVDLFASVERSHPDLALGPSLSAFVLWWGATRGMSDHPQQDLDRAMACARRGTELGDDTGLSHIVVAALRLHGGGDLDAALAEAQLALARRPTCDVAYAVEASVQRYRGAWQEAVEAALRAIELSSGSTPWFAAVLASAYYVGERYHDAIDAAERLVDGGAETEETLLILAAAQQALGLERRARATAGLIAERFPGTRSSDLARWHPFRDPAVLERWHAHLRAAGVP